MVRNVYLSVSALVFAVLSFLLIGQGAMFIGAFLVALNWTQILFYISLALVVIVALIFTNTWLVLNEQSPILFLWLKTKQFISNITFNELYKWTLRLVIGIYIILFVIGCCMTYSKINKFNNDIQLSGQWHNMYLEKAKDYNDLKQLYDEQSIDYASIHNELKHRLAMGATGHP
ncbi:MAG: hypothetical protein Q8910_00030 [Bacteroidota bacterium]|nr:hypothetical protein [Bacteroidota bacterium]